MRTVKIVITNYLKKILKKNKIVFLILSYVIYCYLRLVYATAKWNFIYSDKYSKNALLAARGAIFVFWHNKLAIGPYIFNSIRNNTVALVSSHSDGKIISSVISKFRFDVIEGSTNKNPTRAVKSIIKMLSSGYNVAVTPDGPRGPVYQINSNVTEIAKRHNANLIPISCNITKCLKLNSWDKLLIPLPFAEITVNIHAPLELSNDNRQNVDRLRNVLLSNTITQEL